MLKKPKSSEKTIQHILSLEDENELSILVAKGLANIFNDNIEKGIEYFHKSEDSSIQLWITRREFSFSITSNIIFSS